jgi:tRNA nucleotidyltransferase (CCA-adding enzyme)
MTKLSKKTLTKVSRNFMPGTFKFPQYALKVHKLISSQFKDTYIVGGAVRNLLLKKKVVDVDIATSATPKQIKQIFDAAEIKYDSTHEKLGVIVALIDKYKIEITTFRTEQYGKGRFPKVTFAKSTKLDSDRRDFTMNALYYSPELKRILDFHKGTEDIKNKVVRFIGSAEKRIQEDPLRIVRAYRFALQYNLKLQSKTKRALENNLHLLKKVSATRIAREINQINFANRKKLEKTLQKVIHSNA